MIVVDTNILSTFACVNRLELLFQVAERDTLYLPPAVFNELNEGLSRGKTYLQPLLDKIQTDTTFKLVALTANEGRFMSTLPDQLHTGEREAIALCALRDESVLLTNDKRAYRYCKANLIVSLDLKNILRRL